MTRVLRICLQSLLKLANAVVGLGGMGIILYALWIMKAWFSRVDSTHSSASPWFIYTLLCLGIFFCLISCAGHVAAETMNAHCLSCYMVFVFLLFLLEAAVTAYVFLNRNWEEDFPYEATGRLDELKNFIKSNFEICKWTGLVVVGAQAFSMFLAIVIRALGPDHGSYYDSDDDYTPARLPLLRDQVQHPPYVAANPQGNPRADSWILRINDKVNRN